MANYTFDDPTLTIPGQIKFPATQSASSDVNTLDDYEEGSWTPVIGGNDGTSGQTYAVQVGRYVKIGKLVFIEGYAVLSNKGTITGAVEIKGLPFAIENITNHQGAMPIYWVNLNTSWVYLVALIEQPGSTDLTVRGATAAAGGSNTTLSTTDIANSSAFTVSGCYRTDN